MAKTRRLSLKDIYFRQNLQKLEWARPISEEFPNVLRIDVDAEYISGSALAPGTTHGSFHYEPNQKAYFRRPCRSSNSCVSEGFDLSPDVFHAVNHGESERDGRLTCMGWESEDRINKSHCLTQMKYKIRVTYAS